MKSSERGFTIIELMIATAVFAVMLLITTTTIIGISNTYIKSSIQNQTQQASRAVINDISQDIQLNNPTDVNLSGLNPSGSSDYFDFCIGQDVYAYRLDQVVAGGNWGLVRYQGACPGSTPPTVNPIGQPTTPQAEELLTNNERVGGLSIVPININGVSAFTINVEIGYGNSSIGDSLLSDSPPIFGYAHFNSPPPKPITPPKVGYGYYVFPYACQSGLDSSFCAVSSLTTTVASRIN